MARVLTVDDNAIDRLALKAILESMGHEVVEADDGAIAMQLMNERRADLVLLDINMPDMDGNEMLSLLRQAWSKEELPIIIVTGMDDRKALSDVLVRGANDFIMKPITPMLVQTRLALHLELLDLRRSQE